MIDNADQPPLPELDAETWRHVQKLADLEQPNGPTDELEAAVEIASRGHWILKVDDHGSTVSRDELPGFDDAVAALRRWRDASGGALLMTQATIRDPAERQGGLWLSLIVTEDAEVLTLVATIGQRMIEQSSDMLNLSVGYAMVDAAIDRARRLRLQLAIDMQARRRAIVRALAGEVVWLRRERERLATDASVKANLLQFDHQIQTMLAVLREVELATTEPELLEKLRAAEGSDDVTNTAINFTIDMVTKWSGLNETAERYLGEL